MRILLITPVFHPEPYYLRGLPFARELVRRGLEVEVLTGFPNYPTGRIFPGWRQRLCHRETVEGVHITRVPLYPSHDGSGLKRAITYLSHTLSMCLQGPFRIRKPDLVHVNQGHATECLPADLIQILRGAPYLLDIQDLWPESVLDSRMLRLPGGKIMLDALCHYTYRRARHIVTLSEGVKVKLVERGVPGKKVSVLYNWCDAEQEKPLPKRGEGPDHFHLHDTFNVVYAGNLGPVQALGTVLEAAALLREKKPRVRFLLIGSGLEETALKKTAAEQGLNNVLFIPRQPIPELNQILAYADAVLVHLKDTALNRVGIPSKVQHCLAIGRPILIGAPGSALEVVERARAGVSFEPGNAQGMAATVERLCDMSHAEREALGQRGREFYLGNMSFDIGMTRLIELYRQTASARQ